MFNYTNFFYSQEQQQKIRKKSEKVFHMNKFHCQKIIMFLFKSLFFFSEQFSYTIEIKEYKNKQTIIVE
jgi:hypothetical protein